MGRHTFYATQMGDKRTMESFNKRFDLDHYTNDIKSRSSRLEMTNINMVDMFPLDTMHLIDIGVTKQIMSAIFRNKCRPSIDIKAKAERYDEFKPFKVHEFL